MLIHSSRSIRVLVFSLSALAVAACSGSKGGTSAAGETCSNTGDCQSGLKCINRVCGGGTGTENGIGNGNSCTVSFDSVQGANIGTGAFTPPVPLVTLSQGGQRLEILADESIGERRSMTIEVYGSISTGGSIPLSAPSASGMTANPGASLTLSDPPDSGGTVEFAATGGSVDFIQTAATDLEFTIQGASMAPSNYPAQEAKGGFVMSVSCKAVRTDGM